MFSYSLWNNGHAGDTGGHIRSELCPKSTLHRLRFQYCRRGICRGGADCWPRESAAPADAAGPDRHRDGRVPGQHDHPADGAGQYAGNRWRDVPAEEWESAFALVIDTPFVLPCPPPAEIVFVGAQACDVTHAICSACPLIPEPAPLPE